VISGRRKSHHAHEVTDAYAEGWEARGAWICGQSMPVNPYEHAPATSTRKQSEARRDAQTRDAVLWQRGWSDRDSDLALQDLPDVTPSDFVHAPIVGLEPQENSEVESDEVESETGLEEF